jgi:hypothetical protein
MMALKRCRRKRMWFNEMYYPAFAWRDWVKHENPQVSIAGFRTEIWTQDQGLLNTHPRHIRFKTFTATWINKIFSGYNPCQQTKTGRRFRDDLCPHSDALRMGTEIVPETSVSFSLLTRIITGEDFINSPTIFAAISRKALLFFFKKFGLPWKTSLQIRSWIVY